MDGENVECIKVMKEIIEKKTASERRALKLKGNQK